MARPQIETAIAQKKDILSLAQIFHQVSKLHTDFLTDEFAAQEIEQAENYLRNIFDDADYVIFKAEMNGAAAGYLILQIRNYPQEYYVVRRRGFVESVGVDEKLRGQGIGTALLAFAEKWLREHNIRFMDIDYYKFNEDAGKLYDKLGFKELKTYCRKDLSDKQRKGV